MKQRNKRTLWAMLTEPNTIPTPESVAKFWRTSLGRSITRKYRKSPRAQAYLVLLTVLLAIASEAKAPYEKLTYEAWTSLIQDLQAGLFSMLPANVMLLIAVIASFISVLLFGSIGGMGVNFTLSPTCSKRRRMKRLQRGAYMCTAIGLAAMVVLPHTLALARYDGARHQQAYAAGLKILKLDVPTIERILAEEQSGHWWADPGDDSAVREIKLAWVQTGMSGRTMLKQLARDRIKMKEKHSPIKIKAIK